MQLIKFTALWQTFWLTSVSAAQLSSDTSAKDDNWSYFSFDPWVSDLLDISITTTDHCCVKSQTGASMQARNDCSNAAQPAILYPDDAQHAAYMVSDQHWDIHHRTRGWAHTKDRTHNSKTWVCICLIWPSYSELWERRQTNSCNFVGSTFRRHSGSYTIASFVKQYQRLQIDAVDVT